MEASIENENKKEELRKKLTELLNAYSEEPVDLSREERKFLESEVGFLEKYGHSKYRRTWLELVHGQFEIALALGIEPKFFQRKKEEMEKFLPFFSGTYQDLEKDTLSSQALKATNEFEVSQEIIEKTNQILKEAIEELS